MGLVKLQDSFTKSQEFVHQLDKNLRLSFNKSWSEFYTDPNAARLMNTAEYKTAVARASEETQRAIFSLSFKSRETTLGELAGLVVRSQPVNQPTSYSLLDREAVNSSGSVMGLGHLSL